MRNVSVALKYVLEHTGLSAKELRIVIESATVDYDGDDYTAWLAAQFVRMLEDMGTTHTEVLAKWPEYLIEIEEESLGSSDALSPEGKTYFNTCLEDSDYVTSFFSYTDYLENRDDFVKYEGDWRLGYDSYQSGDFIDNAGDAFRDILNGLNPSVPEVGSVTEDAPVLTVQERLGTARVSKTALSTELGMYGISVQNEGALVLARLLNIFNAHPNVKLRAVLHSNSEFWSNPNNQSIVESFFDVFSVDEAVYANARMFNKSNIRGGTDLVVTVSTDGDNVSVLWAESIEGGNSKAFYASDAMELDSIARPKLSTTMHGLTTSGEIVADVDGNSDALCYIGRRGLVLVAESLPMVGTDYIAVTADTVIEHSVYYGLTKATQDRVEYSNGIPVVLDGLPGYRSLVANCLPMLFYGIDSRMRDHGAVSINGVITPLENTVMHDDPVMVDLHNDYYSYMDFEAKALWDFGRTIEQDEGNSLAGYRQLVESGEEDDPEFVEEWSMLTDKLKTHLLSNYLKFIPVK